VIIKGKSRGGPAALATHLGNAEKNERVSLLETRGTVANDLRGALVEMDAYALGTRCEKSLYHAAMSPEPPHRLSPEQRAEAIDALEEKLGLEGHARVVVMHEKLGREHIHVVWSRIDTDRMRSVSDSHNYRKHEEVARDLERSFGHDRVQGAHVERDGVSRPDRTPSRAELRQEERSGIKGTNVKRDVTEAFRASDGPVSFKAALEDKGYILAKGDRRDFVVVDRAGGIHSLARRIDGIKAAELREFMTPLDRDSLPSITVARALADEERRKQSQPHDDANLEKSYARGDDYVSQTHAALKDHQRRQGAFDAGPKVPRSHGDDEQRISGIRNAADDRKRSERQENQGGPQRATKDSRSLKDGGAEITDRMRRLLDAARGDERDLQRDDDLEPDRQREAPGGGRTRSR